MSAGFQGLLMQLGGLGGMEWIFIIVIIVVIFFGVKKIPELARTFGKAGAEYEKAKLEAKRELQQMKTQSSTKVGREKLEEIAESLGIDYTNKNDDELRSAIEVELNKTKKYAFYYNLFSLLFVDRPAADREHRRTLRLKKRHNRHHRQPLGA